MNSIPTYVLQVLITNWADRIPTSYIYIEVIWRSSIATTCHNWALKSWIKQNNLQILTQKSYRKDFIIQGGEATYHIQWNELWDHIWLNKYQYKLWWHSCTRILVCHRDRSTENWIPLLHYLMVKDIQKGRECYHFVEEGLAFEVSSLTDRCYVSKSFCRHYHVISAFRRQCIMEKKNLMSFVLQAFNLTSYIQLRAL